MKNVDRDLFFDLSDCVFDLERDVPYAAALAMQREGERMVLQNRRQTVEDTAAVRGVVFTAFTGRLFLEAAVNDLKPASLKQAVQVLRREARKTGIRYDGPKIEPGPARKESFYVRALTPPEELPLQEKIGELKERHARLRGMDARTADAVIQYGHVREREFFVNRRVQLYQRLCRTQIVAAVFLSDKTRSVSLHTGHCYQGGWEHASLSEEETAGLVEDAGRMMEADRLSPGVYDVAFSPEFAGIFAHEAFGHGMEADMFLKKRARGELFMGKPVASPLVNLLDDPSLPGMAASYYFDHEGQLSSPTHIVENGILKRALTDVHSALRLSLPPTANGRRESYLRKVYVRMSNTFFGAGTHTLDQMLADMDHGYLLDRPSNGMEDPKGWGIQLEGYLAREIRRGRLTGRVFSPVIVTGTVPELLHSVSMVGDRVEIGGLGMCGKGHKEWVKVTDGGPYLRLRARLG